MNDIAVYLTPAEVKEFKKFQQHYDIFCLLMDRKIFAQKNASVTLHFDHEGTLRTIQRADVLYNKKHDS